MEPNVWFDSAPFFGDILDQAKPSELLPDEEGNNQEPKHGKKRPQQKQLACLSCRRKKVKVCINWSGMIGQEDITSYIYCYKITSANVL